MKLKFLVAFLICILTALPCNAQTTTHKATLNYTASPDSGVTYGILKSSTPGGAKTKIATGITTLSFIDANLAANIQVCYQVVAESAGKNDSTPTNEACGNTNKDTTSPPGALTLTIQ
jgi:hypothetical protein